jgi:histidinol phosphatase-like PHP family hydrolase
MIVWFQGGALFQGEQGMKNVDTADWHVHYFRDGCAEPEMTVEPILRAAAEKGIDEIGLLGHYRNRLVIHDLAYWIEPNPKFFDFLRHDLDAARSTIETDSSSAGRRLKVRVGAEVDINTLDGEVSITPERASQIDYVMASIHWPPTLPPHIDYIDLRDPARLVEAYCPYNNIQPEEFSFERLVGDMFASMTNAITRNPFIDILAHPTAFTLRMGALCIEMDISDHSNELAAALASYGVAYELNDPVLADYSPEMLDGFVKPLIRQCAEAGVMFAIGSDAHLIRDVGEMQIALGLKDELGIPDGQIVTSLEMFSRNGA